MPKKLSHKEYLEKLAIKNENIDVDEFYVNNGTPIMHRCKICGHVWPTRPRDTLRGHGCPICSGRVIGPAPEYRNSIWASEYREYFSKYLTEEQMKMYTPHSGVRVDAVCPDCGLHKNIIISNLYTFGLGCICQDGVSFPNKFVFNIMQQLGLETKPEYEPSWSQKRKYDIYIEDFNLIIENHGDQHYSDVRIRNGARTLEAEQQNDLLKYSLAIENGVNNYVVLDCRKSNKEWIKDAIMNSALPSILCFKEEDINWDDALLYATNSLVKTSADLFNCGFNAKEISELTVKHRSTICKWLKLATQLGLCNYNPKDEVVRVNAKKIRCIELDIVFDSIRQAAKFIKQSPTSILNCLKGRTYIAGGYHWEYV